MNERITSFRDDNYFLSNFYPCNIFMDGLGFHCTENAFQAAKTLNRSERYAFQSCSAGQSKKLGRTITLRPDWEEVKVPVMRTLLFQKFAQNPLCDQLLATGDAVLIEGNDWNDTFWGMCYSEGAGELVGKNYLGQLLMEVREHYRILKATEA